MRHKTNKLAYIFLILSIIIILFGCKSKKQIVETVKTNVSYKISDSLFSSSSNLNEVKNEFIYNNENISLEYSGENNNDSLIITNVSNKIIIKGKGKLNINKSNKHHNINSKTLSSINDTIISINNEHSIKEEIKTKEEVITKRNGFNYYIIGLMVLVVGVLLIIHYVKKKLKF